MRGGAEEVRYPDTAEGAREYLAGVSTLSGVEDARVRPDPQVKGVWEVATDHWRAIVYLGGYRDPFGRMREWSDFEVEWTEEEA